MDKIEIVAISVVYCISMLMISFILGTRGEIIMTEVIGSLGLMVTLCLCSSSR